MNDELAALSIEVFVPDVAASLRFYIALGFVLVRDDPAGSFGRGDRVEFAGIALGDARLILQDERGTRHAAAAASGNARGAGVDIRIIVADVDAAYALATGCGAKIIRDIGDRDYGLRDFILQDADGFRMRFAAPIG